MRKLSGFVLLFVLAGVFYCLHCESYTIGICEDQENVTITCPQNTTISIEEIVKSQTECTNMNNDRVCISSVKATLIENCGNADSCIVSPQQLFHENCPRTAKYLNIGYSCSCVFRYTFRKCANVLSQLHCYRIWCTMIQINGVLQKDNADNHSCYKQGEKDAIERLCKNKNKCQNPGYSELSLYHRNFVTVTYKCLEKQLTEHHTRQYTTVSEFLTKGVTIDTSSDISSVNSESVTYSNTEPVIPISTLDAKIDLDRKGRLLLRFPNSTLTTTFCGTGWDNTDAIVICRYLYRSHSNISGQAIQMSRIDANVMTINFKCLGNETMLEDCEHEYEDTECGVLTVAGVMCCEESGSLQQCSKDIPENDELYTTKTKTAMTIGTTVGVIALGCIVVMLIILFRRYHIGKRDSEQVQGTKKTTEDYVGQQSVALSDFPFHQTDFYNTIVNDKTPKSNDETTSHDSSLKEKSTPGLYFSLDTAETGYDRTMVQNGRYELAKPFSMKEKQMDEVYSVSKDGVYDRTHVNKHVDDQNIYSHSIDNLYDSTERQCDFKRTQDTYDHFFGKTTEDDYDLTKST